jgi:GNAT superfamily N-acetyltransferase
MIREATKDDIPRLVELGRVMHTEASRLNKLRYVPGKVYVLLSSMVGAEHCFVRVVEEQGEVIGGLVAAVEPHWFSTDLLAYDLALFVRPDKRGGLAAARLVAQYKVWAKERGAVITQLGISTGVNLASTGALLERIGFKPSGFLFDAE